MPKVDKPKIATSARAAAHPTSTSKAASTKKRKKTDSSAHHSASLGDELVAMQNPGKLKPIKNAAGANKKPKHTNAEEQKLENELLVATAARKTKGRAALEDDENDGADMVGDDEDEEVDEYAADEAEQMAKDEAAQISARLSKKILQQVHAQQREELEGEGVDEERQGYDTGTQAHEHSGRKETHLSSLCTHACPSLS